MSPRAVIIGPPGAGKSTVGALLADRLGVEFRDVDADIVAATGRQISEIFTEDGEPVFRELEETHTATGLHEHAGVLALGGGAVMSERTRALLAGHPVVFLKVGVTEGVNRTGLSGARPLLAGVNPRATFKAMLEARLVLYREVAVLEVDTDERTPAEVADEILEQIGSLAG
ncbi:MAG TPA: shikimate kinase [Pseudonocardiaceae bacterium]|jgi:shikimate kinase|nr:shikimate kinase [Pseudonocardiaceae bacterium]